MTQARSDIQKTGATHATCSRAGSAGLAGGLAAFGVSSCCVLPMLFVLAGAGGSWLGVFAGIASAGYYVGAASLVVIALGWVVALRRGAMRRTWRQLAAGSTLAGLAWVIMLNETAITDKLISLM